MQYFCPIFTQRRSVAKSVGCFQQRLFVCVFVCQQDNFRMSKHRMVKLGGRCIVQKYRPILHLGLVTPGCAPTKNVALGYDVGKISAGCLVVGAAAVVSLQCELRCEAVYCEAVCCEAVHCEAVYVNRCRFRGTPPVDMRSTSLTTRM